MKRDALQWVSSVHITPPKMAKMASALIDSRTFQKYFLNIQWLKIIQELAQNETPW